MPTDIIGTRIVIETSPPEAFTFQPGPVFTQILLADESTATPKTQSAPLEAMWSDRSPRRGNPPPGAPVLRDRRRTLKWKAPTLLEAQLDRFPLKLYVRFPRSMTC